MNKRPGHIVVTTAVGYCNFCQRTRNLRSEERQLGALVRTTITCESCHRTLSSSIGVAKAEEPAATPEAAPLAGTPPAVETAAAVPAKAAATRPRARSAAAGAPNKAPARKPAAARKSRPAK